MSEPWTSAEADDAEEKNVEEMPSAETTASEPSSPVEKIPNILKRFLGYLFNTETRLGQFNKSFLRLLVLILIFFAGGVLAAYFVLYQPAKTQLTATTTTLRDTTAQLNDTVATLDEVDAALADMTTAYDELVQDYAYTTVQNELLRVYALVVDAQLLIKDKNLVPAKKNLAEARDLLDAALPEMKKFDAANADRLDARLDLVISEFGNDVKAAESDLMVMVDWLVQFDDDLQKAIER
jgi:hypothetical protein